MATRMVELDLDGVSIWDQLYSVAPLVLVGTESVDGDPDLAPKHEATPVGWGRYYAFVCTPEHRTYQNVEDRGSFTVSYPTPDQVVAVGQAAAPRVDDGGKPTLALFETVPAERAAGPLIVGASLHLECEVDQLVEGMGRSALIIGRVLRAAAAPGILRGPDVDDADLLRSAPPLAFVSPNRYAVLDDTRSFPFPLDFHR